MSKNNALGKRIKELRSELDLTLRELADKLHVSFSLLAMYERGERQPPIDKLQQLASFFSVSVDYLLGNIDERSPADKIKAAISSDPDLANFWREISEREDLQLLFKQTRSMSPEGVRQVIRIITAIEDEEQELYNS